MKQETVDPNTRFTVHAKSHLRLIALSLVCYTKTLCTMTCNEAFNTVPKTLCAIQVERNPLVGSGAARGGWGGGRGTEGVSKIISSSLRTQHYIRVQELCESRGVRPGLSVLMSITVSVDVKQH